MGRRATALSAAVWAVLAAPALALPGVEAAADDQGAAVRPVDVAAAGPLLEATKRDVRNALSSPALGPHVQALIADASGRLQLSLDTSGQSAPASTLKLLTAVAALRTLGPDAVLATSVRQGDRPGDVVLVGGGDATLQRVRRDGEDGPGTPATLSALAGRTAAELTARGRTRVRLGYDSGRFPGPAVAPSWPKEYVRTGVVAPVTALMVDQALLRPGTDSFARSEQPAQQAAEEFAKLLAARGVRVTDIVESRDASLGKELARVESPPVWLLVQRMLTESDNQLAEALGRLAAAADGEPATFQGAASLLRRTAYALGAPVGGARLLDSSGLSRDDRLSPTVLATVLLAAVRDPQLRPVLTGLPVAAFTGTLADRYRLGPARAGAGVVRAKTGTLDGITAEAGIVVDAAGDLRVFAFLADAVRADAKARTAMDAAASALASD